MAQFPQVPEPCAPGVSPVWAIRALQLWLSHNFCECASGWDWIVVLKAWQLLLWTPLWVDLPLHTAVRDTWQWILWACRCVSPSITGCKAWSQLLKACWDTQQVSQSRKPLYKFTRTGQSGPPGRTGQKPCGEASYREVEQWLVLKGVLVCRAHSTEMAPCSARLPSWKSGEKNAAHQYFFSYRKFYHISAPLADTLKLVNKSAPVACSAPSDFLWFCGL